MKRSRSYVAAIVVLIACLWAGVWIAHQRPLWNDEYFTQVASIYSISYGSQISGHIPEGANTPLFYLIQKLFLQLIHYQTPSQWLQGHWYSDASSQIVLRTTPIIFMSLSVALVFYYFCRRYSLGIGFYSLFIYSSSYMLWAYWAEARPYALWVFLTTAQSVVLLNRFDQYPRMDDGKESIWLAGINILLAFTSILSLGQIIVASVLWGGFKKRECKKYIFVTLVPVIIVIFYYMQGLKLPFYFGLSPEQLIRDNISRQRIDILFIFIVSLVFYLFTRRDKVLKHILGPEILQAVAYFIFMMLVLASSAVLLAAFALHAQSSGQGFPITSRYFICLTPIGVIATTMVSVALAGSLSKHPRVQWMFMGLIGLLLVQNFLKIVPTAIHSIVGG